MNKINAFILKGKKMEIELSRKKYKKFYIYEFILKRNTKS